MNTVTADRRAAQFTAAPIKSARELLPAAYPPPMTTARQIVTDFLTARVAANNARLTFILDQTPENLTAWVNADAALDDLHDADYYPAVPGAPLEGAL